LSSELWTCKAPSVPPAAAQNLVPPDYSALYVTPAARLNLFPDQAVTPWVSFGGGFSHFGENSTLEFGGPNPIKGGTTTGVLQAGIGLNVRFIGRFQPAGRGSRLLVGDAEPESEYGKRPPAQYFCRRRTCLPLLNGNDTISIGPRLQETPQVERPPLPAFSHPRRITQRPPSQAALVVTVGGRSQTRISQARGLSRDPGQS
jgi:hypothetical protein